MVVTSGGGRITVVLVSAALGLFLGNQGAAAGGAAWVDPTRPPGAAGAGADESGAPTEGSLRLRSILVGSGRRVAVIDGRAYRVGDAIGSLTVQNIYRDRVVLKGEGGTRILRLTMSSGMKKAPSP